MVVRYKKWLPIAVGLLIIVLFALYRLGSGEGGGGVGGVGGVPRGEPAAAAAFTAGPLAPQLAGTVKFYPADEGTLVVVDVAGLPLYRPAELAAAPVGPHGFHLHEQGECEVGDPADPFSSAGGHWNPDQQPHGNHAGDFPVLFSHHGNSRMTFVTARFQPQDVVGLSVVIHENPDDYRSQPAGDSGLRLGCGVVAAP